jgi:hypothetical protein
MKTTMGDPKNDHWYYVKSLTTSITGADLMTEIPPDLRARGWRLWLYNGEEPHAVRLDGRADAAFSASAHRNSGLWCGYIERPPRRLRHPTPSLAETLRALEYAERQGLFSDLWGNAPPLPHRRGWVHRVVNGQDQWVTVARDIPLPLIVLTLPVNSHRAGLRFAAFVGDEPITRSHVDAEIGMSINFDALVLFDDAGKAMAAAEREAYGRAQALGYGGPLTFAAPTPSEPVRELSDV